MIWGKNFENVSRSCSSYQGHQNMKWRKLLSRIIFGEVKIYPFGVVQKVLTQASQNVRNPLA